MEYSPHRILSHAECVELHRKMIEGDIEARNKLIESCFSWIRTLCQRYRKHPYYEDLVGECVFHVMKVMKKWIPENGKLTTYVTIVVKNYLIKLRAVYFHNGIYVPRCGIAKLYLKNPSSDDKKAIKKVKCALSCQSIDDGAGGPMIYTIDPEPEIDKISFDELVKNLPAKIQTVLKLYYVDGWLVKKIAKKFKLTRQRISQLINHGLNLLRQLHHLGSRTIENARLLYCE